MPLSMTPGSSSSSVSSLSMSTLAFAEFEAARHSQDSRNPFHAGHVFRGFTGSRLLRPVGLLAPLYGSDWNTQPPGAFTSRLSTDRSPSPLLDMTTTATGLLCWRDSHPLEWQLASLHLLLHRDGLAPSTPCRSPGALCFAPDCVAKVFLSHRSQIFQAVRAAIER